MALDHCREMVFNAEEAAKDTARLHGLLTARHQELESQHGQLLSLEVPNTKSLSQEAGV